MAPKGGFELKTPKGTRDWDGKHMVLREQIFDTSKRSRLWPRLRQEQWVFTCNWALWGYV